MKPKFIAVVLLLHLAGGLALKLFLFTDTRKVTRTLLSLQNKISAPMDSGGLDAALYLSGLKPFFTPEINITINSGALENQWQFERPDLLRAITAAKQQNPALSVSLAFTRKDVTVSGTTARVDTIVSARHLNEPIEPQRLFIILVRDEDKQWRVSTVEPPPANPQPQKR
ncbi:MAG: hypothetical protein LBD30_02065 [Verrucomicrobiales bacterium]|jgi:hypothetical protein|nr:hypothetical protein [Verrucomicrobiales bacterium]